MTRPLRVENIDAAARCVDPAFLNSPPSAEVTTIADGVAVRVPIPAALEWMSTIVDDMVLIEDAQLREPLR